MSVAGYMDWYICGWHKKQKYDIKTKIKCNYRWNILIDEKPEIFTNFTGT